MLLQNKSFLSCNGLRHLAGAPATSGVIARSLLGGNAAAQRNRFIGEATFYKGNGTPSGYSPMYAWYGNRARGGMGSRYQVVGIGAATNSKLYAGRSMPVNITALSIISALGSRIFLTNMPINITAQATINALGTRIFIEGMVADMIGEATLNGTATLLVDSLINILCISTLDANLVGLADGIVDMIGQGEIASALGAIGGMVADIIGAGTTEVQPFAIGTLGVSILSYSTLSPESLAAAVWTSLAADFNDPGTTGKALSSASSAGDPWSSIMSEYEDDATFGAFVKKLLTTNGFFGLR